MASQTEDLQWKIIHSPSKERLSLVAAESIHEFWVSDATWKLFHLKNNLWTSIDPPDFENAVHLYYGVLKDRLTICSVTDLDYRAHFFKYDGENWKKYDLVADVPIQCLYIVSENDFWAYSDWGHIYHCQNDKWERIEAPITNHIFCIEFLSNSDIWFGTRAEGIFHYDGSTFTKVEMVGYTEEDIFEIKFFDSQSGLAACRNGNTYQYREMRFELINTELKGRSYLDFEFYDKNLGLALSVKGKLYVYQNGHWTEATLPTSLHLNRVKLLTENSGIITGEKGIILVASPEKRLFFTNIAGRSYVDGSFFDKSVGAAFVDINNDELLDIFVLNTERDQLNRLYLNQKNTRFIDITNQSRLHQSSQSNLFTFGDFDMDGRIDYAFLVDRSPEYTLNLYYNSGDGLFDGPVITRIDPMGNTKPLDLDAGDFDNDGDLDLYLSFHYGPEKKAAKNILLANKLGGHFSNADSTLGYQSPGWNRMALCADFNNDDWLDIYVPNYWREDKLLINRKGIFADVTEDWFQEQEISNAQGAAAVDFDNDGDLDLFLVSLENNIAVYRNENGEHFQDVTKEVGLQFDYPYSPSKVSINFGDFDNDSFIDLFISNLNRQGNSNWLFLNDSGRTFIDYSEGSGLESPIVFGTIVGDVDNDGDLDIYGYCDGSNLLWSNNLNDNNYLEIETRGVRSNRTGLGNKIWVYEAGHLDDFQFFKGYRQIGTDNFEPKMFNSPIAHFGLDLDEKYDIKIQFQGGNSKNITDISPGQKLVVYEMDGFARFLSFLPGAIFRAVTKRSFQLYSLTVLFSICAILLTIKIGRDRYDWDLKIISGIIVFNLSAFWILVLLTNNESFFFKYVLPLVPVLLGTLIPIGISHRIQSLKATFPQDEILNQLLIFSHGEWAMKNLNSLQLLSENALGKRTLEEQLVTQLDERFKTFLDMTGSNLERIIDLGRRAGIEPEIISSLDKNSQYIGSSLQTIRDRHYGNYPFRHENHRIIAAAINQVKLDLTHIRDLVFSKFSSDVLDVIVNTNNSLAEIARKEGVELRRIKINMDNVPVLIPNYELADILDNSIRNAISAVKSSEKKEIIIRVYRYPPAIRIDVEDTGIGIHHKDWDKIFESGFSGFGSTGQGLTQARELLTKYGGRIFIKDSQVGKGSTFTIELKEGRKHDETANPDHR